MAWMLQPKNYIEIGRRNLYNVAYGRVGAYKGLGRFNPTNYLDIGPSPNRIGGTTGQYNTLSGQLSLYPPSLRGLGFSVSEPSVEYNDWQWSRSETDSAPDWWAKVDAAILAGQKRAQQPGQPETKSPFNAGLLMAIGAGLLVVIAASRR